MEIFHTGWGRSLGYGPIGVTLKLLWSNRRQTHDADGTSALQDESMQKDRQNGFTRFYRLSENSANDIIENL